MILIIIMLILFTLFVYLKCDDKENFDNDMTEFVPLGYIRYGLRGEKLNTMPMPDCHFDKYMCYYNSFYPNRKNGSFYPHYYNEEWTK